MSLEINWSLLSDDRNAQAGPSTGPNTSAQGPNSHPSTSDLTAKLIASLNRTLSTTSRPSFIGPISITQFDFGNAGPEIEIRDIRDVWRSFDEVESESEEESDDGNGYQHVGDDGYDEYGYDDGEYYGGDGMAYEDHDPRLNHLSHQDNLHAYETESGYRYPTSISPPELDHDDSISVLSNGLVGVSSRRTNASIAAVGIGTGLLSPTLSMSFGVRGTFSPTTGSIFSHPLSPRPISRTGIPLPSSPPRIPSPTANRAKNRRSNKTKFEESRYNRYQSYRDTTPPHANSSKSKSSSNNLPSLQLHIRLSHTSNLSLTLLTSLIVNYPSPTFMSLPLKLVVTGLELHADIVLAYVGEKKRAHLTIVDSDERQNEEEGYPYFKRPENDPTVSQRKTSSQSQPNGDTSFPRYNANSNSQSQDIGHKILPNLHIETEIGHADVHVLRNVGKVERFIADVVRKLLVDELVWPNFYTVAM